MALEQRTGVDEFAFDDVNDRDQAAAVARKIASRLVGEHRIGPDSQSAMIGVSVGISLFSQD